MRHALLIGLFGLSPVVWSQVTTATYYGVVRDPSDAVIPNAEVTLIHESTGASRLQHVDASGEFAFQFLPVGDYTLHITAPGFKTFEIRGLELRAAQQARRTFVLEVGQVSERVEVTSEAPLVNTVTGEQRESLSTREVSELPVTRRDLAFVMSIGTGITPAFTRDSGQFILNGLGRAAVSFTMDGINASANPVAQQLNMKDAHNYISVVTMDAVAEVQVSKGVFSAEFGRALSGNINVITKSGTNEWHGSLSELFNSEELSARDQFLTSRPGVTFNQYGGSLGGPIIKNRVFIFGAFEGYQERSFQAVQDNVPSERLRRDMLARFPEYKVILDLFPLPNQPTAPNAATGAYIGAGSLKSSDAHAMVKPDIWINSRSKLGATYVHSRPYRLIPRVSTLNPQRFEGRQERLNLNFTFLGGPRWTAESRFGYNKNDRDRTDGVFNIIDPNKKESKFGGRRIARIDGAGWSLGSGEVHSLSGPHRSFEQKFALTLGRHSLKVGGLIYAREIGLINIQNPVMSYLTEADLIANIPNDLNFTFGRADTDGKAKEFGLYAQDDWRVTPRLTLNLGLRYDYFSNLTADKNGDPNSPHIYNPDGLRLPGFIVGPFRPVDNPYNRDALNLGPRVGFAWNPDGQSRTVIRGGFATLFTYLSGEISLNSIQNSATEPNRSRLSRAEAQRLGIRFPAYNEDILPLVGAGSAPPGLQIINPSIKSPYSMNFSLTIERALTRTLALETAFVGTRGVKFTLSRLYNEVDRITGVQPNPAYAADQYFDSSESTHYYSWQTSLRKRYSQNLLMNLHYTWGKAIAYGRGDLGRDGGPTNQDFFDIRSNRGRAEGDITHRFVGDFIYDLPVMSGAHPAARLALGGWQVSGVVTAQTGSPFNVTYKNALKNQRPDLLDPVNVINGDYRSTLQYLNRAAFARVPLGAVSKAALRPGTLGNNAIVGPGLVNADLSIGKGFKVAERSRIQFRAEMLDALNHTNFTGVDGEITSARFGVLTGTAGARRIQLSLRLTF